MINAFIGVLVLAYAILLFQNFITSYKETIQLRKYKDEGKLVEFFFVFFYLGFSLSVLFLAVNKMYLVALFIAYVSKNFLSCRESKIIEGLEDTLAKMKSNS